MIIITYQNLPRRVPALVHENDDDSYTIIINRNLSEANQKAAALHEIRHIKSGDVGGRDGADVCSVESACHGSRQNYRIAADPEIYIKDGE